MSGGDSTILSFAFGDLGSGLWGLAWSARGDAATVVLGRGEDVRVVPARLDAAAVAGEWRVAAEGSELTLEPVGEPVAPEEENGGAVGSDQLCRARGRLALEAEEVDVDCLGWRRARSAEAAVDWATVREAAAWFGPEEGLALTALRPRAAAEHDRDVLEAVVLGSEQSGPVEDPRLSTTYARDGRPKAAGVELWLAREDSDELYPVRASGEAVGPDAAWTQGGVSVRAELFRWRSRGREGAGVYILGRRE